MIVLIFVSIAGGFSFSTFSLVSLQTLSLLNFYNSALLQTERRLISINAFVEDSEDRKFDVARAARRLQQCVPMSERYVRTACIAIMRASVLKGKGGAEPAFAWRDLPSVSLKHVPLLESAMQGVERRRWAFTFLRQVSYFREAGDREVSWLFAACGLLACVVSSFLAIYGVLKALSHLGGAPTLADLSVWNWISGVGTVLVYAGCGAPRMRMRRRQRRCCSRPVPC